MKKIRWTLLMTLIILLLISCRLVDQPKDEVVLQLKWIHQAQFAGYYVAKEKGFYEEQNIDLTIVPGGIGIDPLAELSANNVDIAVLAPEQIIINRPQGELFKAVAVIFQKNPFILISLADSGINTLQDFPGHSIAVANVGGRIQYDLMMKKAGLDLDTLEEVDFGFDYQPFYDGEIDILPVFAAGSYLDVVRDGIEVNTFWPDDYGVHWYSDCIAVPDEMILQNPDLVERFLRATFKGMEYMIANPDEAVEITMKYAEVQDEDVQKAMLLASIPLIYTSESRIGWMEDEKWFGMRQNMYDMGQIDSLVELKELYTLEFIQNIYGAEMMKFSQRLVMVFLPLALVSLIFIGAFSFLTADRMIEESLAHILPRSATRKLSSFERWVRDIKRMMESVAQRPLVVVYVEQVMADDQASDVGEAAGNALVTNHFIPNLTAVGGITDFMVIDPGTGKIMVSSDATKVGKFREAEEYFLQGQSATYADRIRYSISDGETVFHISTPIRNTKGEVIGVLVGHVDLNELSRIMLDDPYRMSSQETYMISDAHLMVTHPRNVDWINPQQTLFSAGIDDCIEKNSGFREYEDYAGVSVYGSYLWSEEWGFCILTEVDRSVARSTDC